MSWLTAEEALARMGTKPQTLYANVSRGRITARPDPDDPRKSLYRQDDVERLARQSDIDVLRQGMDQTKFDIALLEWVQERRLRRK